MEFPDELFEPGYEIKAAHISDVKQLLVSDLLEVLGLEAGVLFGFGDFFFGCRSEQADAGINDVNSSVGELGYANFPAL